MTLHDDIKKYVAEKLNGKCEVKSKYGVTDVVTTMELIEVSDTVRYKESLGRLVTFQSDEQFANLIPRLHIWPNPEDRIDEFEKKLTEINDVCKARNVRLSFQLGEQIYLPYLGVQNR